MVERRNTLKRGLGAAGGKLPKLEEDNVMREFLSVCSTSTTSNDLYSIDMALQNPKFLAPGAPAVTLDYPLFPQIPEASDDPDKEGNNPALDLDLVPSSKGKRIDRREPHFKLASSNPRSKDKINCGILSTSTHIPRNPLTRPRQVAFAEPDPPEAEAPLRKIRRVRLILPDPPS